MPRVNDFSACITVDGSALNEYDVQIDEETRTVTCWIASEAGKAYVVRWHDLYFRSATSGDVVVDGYDCGGFVISETSRELSGYQDGIYTSSTTMTPFTFSQVQTSDDQALLSAPTAPDVGLVTLKIHNVQIVARGLPWRDTPAPESKTYHEKTKKGMNHQTSFQRSVTVPVTTSISTEIIGEPVAVFHFRYRPLAILQAQEIVPRAGPAQPLPSPSGSRKRTTIELDSDGEVIKEVDEDGEETRSEDAKQLAKLQKQMDAIRARQMNNERSRKKVKREPIVGATIDLTEDD
ncbi:hypothetical protein L218DRAFT_907660 [Marasmius fiardii PR-910]|nr:hypothetical protein L218DRAFT_907660 [Marasmius fiardii PR-910]